MAFEAEPIRRCSREHQWRGGSVCPVCGEEVEILNEATEVSLVSITKQIEGLIAANGLKELRLRAQLAELEPERIRLVAALASLKGETPAKAKTNKGRKLNLTDEQRAAAGERARKMALARTHRRQEDDGEVEAAVLA